MPNRKKTSSSPETRFRQVPAVAQKGREWFEKLSDQMQRLPEGTLVLINVDTAQYFTAPAAWDDVEQIEAKRPANDRARYWMCRITEGTDGKKEAGGVYSVGSIQAVA